MTWTKLLSPKFNKKEMKIQLEISINVTKYDFRLLKQFSLKVSSNDPSKPSTLNN